MFMLALYMLAIVSVIFFGHKMVAKGGDGWTLLCAASGVGAVVTAVLSDMTPALMVIASLIAVAIYVAVARTASTMRQQQP